jgi:protein involved in polysaccharide export with SLBB domain
MPGDTLTVNVQGAPDLVAPLALVVRPDGGVQLPWVGEQMVAGRTVPEVADGLTAALKARYQTPNVAINLTKAHAREAFVIGQVMRPGPVAMDGDSIAVAHAIGESGGLTLEASLSNAKLYRAGQAAQVLDLQVAMTDSSEAPALNEGDVLLVERRNQIEIAGEMTKPGVYTVPADGRVSGLVALGGNFTPNADRRRAVLIARDGTAQVVDLQLLLENPASPANVPAADFASFVVPPKGDLVVVGEVKTPGTYRMGAQSRLLEALASAGGLLPTADARNLIVSDDQNQTQTVDASAALADPSSAANVSVADAALVVVPRRRNEISVLGEVSKPATIPAPVPSPLSNLLAQVGGLSKSADPHRVLILRETGRQETVDVSRLVGAVPPDVAAPGDLVDPVINPGDSVVVFRRYARVTVLGAVQDQGSYDFQEGDRAIDAVAAAGGFAEKALRKDTSIIRRQGDKAVVLSLDLRAGLLRGDDALIAEPLQDRDIVYVPRERTPMWRDLATSLTGVSQFARLLIFQK